jgi:phosphatidylglycerol:prolipoprotein diacylglycerol transferase
MHPILFHIGSYAVHTFGVMLMIAFIAAAYRAYHTAAKLSGTPGSPDPTDVLDVSVWVILAGVAGARALFIAIDWDQYRGHPGTWLAIWEGGISFHGALIGGLIAVAVFTIRRHISFLKLVDLLAPSLMLGYAIGRIGCFFNGCCYGMPTSMPWGVRFWDDTRNAWTVPSHPTQIYSSLMSFAFLAVLTRIERHKSFDGQLLGWYLIFAGIERFIMEIWRAGYTSTGIMAFGLTDVQYLCMVVGAIGAVTLVVLRRRHSAVISRPPLGAAVP